MKITFIKDCPPIIASGNSAYKKGVEADLRMGQDLIDAGYAREGWGTAVTPKPTPPPSTLDNLSYRELQRMAKAAGVPANLNREELIEALR